MMQELPFIIDREKLAKKILKPLNSPKVYTHILSPEGEVIPEPDFDRFMSWINSNANRMVIGKDSQYGLIVLTTFLGISQPLPNKSLGHFRTSVLYDTRDGWKGHPDITYYYSLNKAKEGHRKALNIFDQVRMNLKGVSE